MTSQPSGPDRSRPELQPLARVQPRRQPSDEAWARRRGRRGPLAARSIVASVIEWSREGLPGRCRGALSVRRCGPGSGAAQGGPGGDPVVLVLAGRRVVIVGAIGLWGRPVPDLVVVRLVGRVRQLAMARRRASRRSRTPAGWSAPRRTRPWPARWPRRTPCGPSTCSSSSGSWPCWRSSRCRTSRSSPHRAGRRRSAARSACISPTWNCHASRWSRRLRCTRPSGRCTCPSTGRRRRAAWSAARLPRRTAPR